jgi:hypothetical protein
MRYKKITEYMMTPGGSTDSMLRQLGVKAPTRNLIPFLRELQAAASA